MEFAAEMQAAVSESSACEDTGAPVILPKGGIVPDRDGFLSGLL